MIETVKVKVPPCHGNEEGIVIMNKSDFDPKKHQLADEEAAAPAPKINFAGMKKAELHDYLDAAGVAYETDANKERLIELATEHESKQ